MGSEAASSGNSTSAGFTAGAGDFITRGGIARGSGYAQGANALAGGISSGVNNTIGGAYLFGGFGKPK